MTKYKTLKLSDSGLPDLLVHIHFFKKRADDLIQFWLNTDWGRSEVSVDRTDETSVKISGNLPNELYLESLYRRFRFLYHNNEKSNYFRLLKLLSKSTDNKQFQLFCRNQKKTFYNEENLKFAFIASSQKYSPQQIIDYWFNAYYFHDDDGKISDLEALTNKVSENGARVVLYHTVRNCCIKIKYLNHLLSDTSEDNLTIKFPIEDLEKIIT